MVINIRKGNAEDGGFMLEGDIHVTQRELEALAAIAEGYDNENSAKKLGISYTTLRNHTYNIMKKLGAKNRTQAVVKAVENGMIVISLKRGRVANPSSECYVCKYCGRAFTPDEAIEMHEEPFMVNHVLLEPPDWEKCPYDDCNAHASDAYNWGRVKYYHPEYPEIPEKGIVYSTYQLLEAEYQAHLETEREWREIQKND
ncbi:response regulator transcription factor [Chloroflexota bacterium]